jgi:hypothetical protein
MRCVRHRNSGWYSTWRMAQIAFVISEAIVTVLPPQRSRVQRGRDGAAFRARRRKRSNAQA